MSSDKADTKTLSLRLEVRGRVQGVGYRYFCQRTARKLGVAGSVENKYDGSVEVYVSGPESAVREFVAALEEGPRLAVVERVTRYELEQAPQFEGFDIR